jgi:single-stranded-DNA-specific exonuclease
VTLAAATIDQSPGDRPPGALLPGALSPGDWLGGALSLTGRRWLTRPCDDRLALAIAQAHGLPDLAARILAGRGIGFDAVAAHLAPTLRDFLPDPSALRDMDKAAARLAGAVMTGERIALFADYDVDGATSSALLLRFLRAVGSDALLYVPDRILEGYGPNQAAFAALAGQGARLVVTLDCGITAHAPLEAARDAGLEVIVIDHHAAEMHLPAAFAIINPNRLDESGALGHLAAVGVTFLTLVAVNRHLRHAGWYRSRPEPDLRQWLDLVAFGTVADVVPLTGLNRAFVTQGLKIMGQRRNAGLAALADVAGVSETPGAYHLGFVLGPRVNAGGRVGRADCGARLLSTDDPLEAASLAALLDGHNVERRAIESATLDAAIGRVEAGGRASAARVIVVAGEGWHPGVIGIVASRLVERYHRPACVVALAGGIGKGSGRSVAGIDLGAAVIAARQSGLLAAGGGHRMAAGFTVAQDRIDAFAEFLEARIAEAGPSSEAMLSIDGMLTCGGVTVALAEIVERLGPFGSGNAEPRFALSGARIVKADLVGGSHVRCILTDSGGARLKAIAFRAVDTPLGKALIASGGVPISLAGRIKLDRWNGETRAQFQIEDAARA